MSVLQAFVFLNVFFMALLRFADVSTKDLIAILIVANLQISLGGLIWARLISRESIDLVEFVGMGGALGFGLSLISSQLFRSLAPFSVSWLILPLLWLVTSHLKSGVTSGVLFVKLQNTNDMLLICSGTLIALSTAWYWLVSTAVAVFLWVVLRYLRGSNRARGFSHSKFQSVLFVAAVVMSFRALHDLSSLSELRNSLWWNLRYGVMQDQDSIFFESMMQSARNLGWWKYIFYWSQILLPLVRICMGSHFRFDFKDVSVCSNRDRWTGNRVIHCLKFGFYDSKATLNQFIFSAQCDVFGRHVMHRTDSFFEGSDAIFFFVQFRLNFFIRISHYYSDKQ